MTIPYVPPAAEANAFNCPHCLAFANQQWSDAMMGNPNLGNVPNGRISRCANCHSHAFWIDRRMVYPLVSTAPLPNADLPSEVLGIYNEARDILQRSPRGAAALLRLAIQELCVHAGESGKNLNNDIGSLVKKGLRPHVQQALDIVRVIGNNAVHPGQIELKDDQGTASALFGLVNVIAQQMITDPKEAEALYMSLPAEQREAIERRDGTKTR